MPEVLKTLRRDFGPLPWIPIGMSLAALALVLGHIALYGTAREADEGAAAHLWQLLMAVISRIKGIRATCAVAPGIEVTLLACSWRGGHNQVAVRAATCLEVHDFRRPLHVNHNVAAGLLQKVQQVRCVK